MVPNNVGKYAVTRLPDLGSHRISQSLEVADARHNGLQLQDAEKLRERRDHPYLTRRSRCAALADVQQHPRYAIDSNRTISLRPTPLLIQGAVGMAWVVHILAVTPQDGLAGIVFKICDLELKHTVARAGPSDRCDANKTRQEENHGKHPYKIG